MVSRIYRQVKAQHTVSSEQGRYILSIKQQILKLL